MATVNFMLTSPIAVNGDVDVAETAMVKRTHELFQELQRVPGIRMAMSDIGYADGMDYYAIISVKNQWYKSGTQLRKVAERYDPQFKERVYNDVEDIKYSKDLPRLEHEKMAGFRKAFHEFVYMTSQGRQRVVNALGVEYIRLPAGTKMDYYNQYNSLVRVREEQFNGEMKTGYIDIYGMPVMKTVYDEISAPDKKGICCASLFGKKGIVAIGDRQIIPFDYDDIKGANLDLLKDPQNLNKEKESKVSIFSENGHILAKKMTDAGLRWGVIDRDNRVVIPFEFETLNEVYSDDARYAKYGFLIAQKDGKVGMIDKEGSVAVPFEYDYLGVHDLNKPQLGRVDDGYLFAYKDNRVGVIDINNRIAIPFRPKEILKFKYPQISFSIRPMNRSVNECRADLSRLEELCKNQVWTYEWSSEVQVRKEGEANMKELYRHFNEISEWSIGEATKIWERYAPANFPVPSIELSEREQKANAKIFLLKVPRESDIYARPEERVGVFITPQERVNTIVGKIRDAEAARSEIAYFSYDDARDAALEGGFFTPDWDEFKVDQERRLSKIDREIDVLYKQLEVAEANVRKFEPPLERRKEGIAPTNTLQNIEQGLKEKMSRSVSPLNCEQKM